MTFETNFEAWFSIVVLMLVEKGMISLLTFKPITISSKAGVAGPLTDAVDGAFHLTRSRQYTGQGIGHCQTQIIVAMGGKGHLVCVRNSVAQHGDDVEEFLRRGIAHRVGHIDRGGAGMDRHFHASAQKIRHRAGGIFR